MQITIPIIQIAWALFECYFFIFYLKKVRDKEMWIIAPFELGVLWWSYLLSKEIVNTAIAMRLHLILFQ